MMTTIMISKQMKELRLSRPVVRSQTEALKALITQKELVLSLWSLKRDFWEKIMLFHRQDFMMALNQTRDRNNERKVI